MSSAKLYRVTYNYFLDSVSNIAAELASRKLKNADLDEEANGEEND